MFFLVSLVNYIIFENRRATLTWRYHVHVQTHGVMIKEFLHNKITVKRLNQYKKECKVSVKKKIEEHKNQPR
jgi:hypothetical protein